MKLPRSLLPTALLGAVACSSGPSAPASTQGATLAWVDHFGDAAGQQASGIALDPGGNVLLTGNFKGVLQFGPHTLSAQPSGSLFVAKLDPSGRALWGSTWSSTSTSEGDDIVADHNGNLLLLGRAGPPATSPTAPSDGFFVAKLDPAGGILWKTPLQSAYDRFNLTVTGGGYSMLSARTAAGLYLQMLDPTGGECWNLAFPITCASGMSGIAANANASLAITGYYDCPVDFGGGPLAADGQRNAFVATYDSQGNYVWGRGFGASGSNVAGRSVAMDDTGDVFVAGDYTGSPDFGGGSLPQSTGGLFVVELDAHGHHVWSHGYDGASLASGRSVALGPSNDLFVMGQGVAPSGVNNSAPEPQGTFVLMLTTSGRDGGLNSFVPRDAPSSFSGAGIAVGAHGQVAFAGSLSGAAEFGQTSIVSAGSSDVVAGVIAK